MVLCHVQVRRSVGYSVLCFEEELPSGLCSPCHPSLIGSHQLLARIEIRSFRIGCIHALHQLIYSCCHVLLLCLVLSRSPHEAILVVEEVPDFNANHTTGSG